jgi:ABC-type sugar transport system substrate-binding protein
MTFKKLICTGVALLSLAATVTVMADEMAGGGSSAELRKRTDEAIIGKSVGWIPVARGIPITDSWTAVLQQETAASGMKLEVKDPNFKAEASVQALEALIAAKPDVIVVHNPNVQVLVSGIKRAQEAGIIVVQQNMVSNYKSDGYVGADWVELGRKMGEDIIKACGKATQTSHKVQIVLGEQTSAASLDQERAVLEVLATDPSIQIVSKQASNWDPAIGEKITATVIQQHPDLCANYSFSGLVAFGSANALKAAGALDHGTKVFTSTEGAPNDCKAMKDGLIHEMIVYNSWQQGFDLMTMIKTLLQLKAQGVDTSKLHLANYTNLERITPDNLTENSCWSIPK